MTRPWQGIVGKGFSADSFQTYVDGITLGDWTPSFCVLHNTAIPTFAEWHNISGAARMLNLQSYYRDTLRWSAGPHLFVVDDGIWVFTTLTVSGVHAPSWNAESWGIEMVGDYDNEWLKVEVLNNTVAALATLHAKINISPDTLRFHREDPETTHKNCPGKNVIKADIIADVKAKMGNPL